VRSTKACCFAKSFAELIGILKPLLVTAMLTVKRCQI
jgi:hypothetical protein